MTHNSQICPKTSQKSRPNLYTFLSSLSTLQAKIRRVNRGRRSKYKALKIDFVTVIVGKVISLGVGNIQLLTGTFLLQCFRVSESRSWPGLLRRNHDAPDPFNVAASPQWARFNYQHSFSVEQRAWFPLCCLNVFWSMLWLSDSLLLCKLRFGSEM